MTTDEETPKRATIDEAPAAVGAIAAAPDFEPRARLTFPVVGVGASAGGLRAICALIQSIPPDSGMAFVVLQHLPPEHDSLMASILSRHTPMPVLDIEDGLPIQPGNVYVSRPSHKTLIVDGRLRLGETTVERGHRCPIDDFFRSLAAEQKERAIAVVLSGMGTNGTAGAQAIKASGGLCVAQEPSTAEYPGMPESLIRSGYADLVLRADAIGPALIAYARHPYLDPDPQGPAATQLMQDERHHREVLALLRERDRRT